MCNNAFPRQQTLGETHPFHWSVPIHGFITQKRIKGNHSFSENTACQASAQYRCDCFRINTAIWRNSHQLIPHALANQTRYAMQILNHFLLQHFFCWSPQFVLCVVPNVIFVLRWLSPEMPLECKKPSNVVLRSIKYLSTNAQYIL